MNFEDGFSRKEESVFFHFCDFNELKLRNGDVHCGG